MLKILKNIAKIFKNFKKDVKLLLKILTLVFSSDKITTFYMRV